MQHVTDLAENDSKGCGGVMRVAPIGMYFASLAPTDSEDWPRLLAPAFDLACNAAAITHGHPTGQLASGAFAAIIMELLLREPLSDAIDAVLPLLAVKPRHEETTEAIHAACRLAAEIPNDSDALTQLGEGWVAEEALAIALYCALSTEDFRSGVVLAVNHNGDSDSTGSMAGQLLGAMYGVQAIPNSWLEPLELRCVIETEADGLGAFRYWPPDSGETTVLPSSASRYSWVRN
jgi:ADP-ribosylglycohydrolase